MAPKKPAKMKAKKTTARARATKKSTSQSPKRALRVTKPEPIVYGP